MAQNGQYALLNKPPEGVLAGESVPRENEVEAEQVYNRLKRERLDTLERHEELAENAETKENSQQ